jgi:hypothetical protein
MNLNWILMMIHWNCHYLNLSLIHYCFQMMSQNRIQKMNRRSYR